MSNIQNHQTLKQLFISPQILSHENLINITQQINTLNQETKLMQITVRTLAQNDEDELRLKLLVQSYGIGRRKEICERWAICEGDEYVRGDVGGDWSGVTVLDWKDIPKNGIIHKSNVFVVRSLREAFSIVSLDEFSLKKRQKLQLMLRKSQIKFEDKNFLNQLRKLGYKLSEKIMKQQIKYVAKSLGWFGRKRIKLLRKYFNEWLIVHYQLLIQKREEEIIKGDYLLQHSNRKIMIKYFNAWKSLKYSLV